MVAAVAYNGLGQIIADGGVIAAANMLAQGDSYGQIVGFFQQRYEGAPDSDLLELIGLATVGIAAGSQLTSELAAAFPTEPPTTGEQLTVITPEGPVSIGVESLAEIANQSAAERGMLANAIDVGLLPLVPDLFGDTPEGRRAELSLEVNFGTSEERVRIDVDLAGIETWADLLELIESRIGQIEDTDPTRLAGLSDEDKFDIVTRIIYGARRW